MSFFHLGIDQDRCLGTTLDFLHTWWRTRPPVRHGHRLVSVSWNFTDGLEFAVFLWPIRIYSFLRFRPRLKWTWDWRYWARDVRNHRELLWETNGFDYDLIARRRYLGQELEKMNKGMEQQGNVRL